MLGVPPQLPDAWIADDLDRDVALVALSRADLPRIGSWLAHPHVARWWGPRDKALSEIADHLDSAIVAPFLALADRQPVGYLQIYHANSDRFWAARELPFETFGADLFIGDVTALGNGLGPRFLQLVIRHLLRRPEIVRIQIDPDPDNRAAIRAYEKAGFRRVGRIDTPDGPALYMVVERPAPAPAEVSSWPSAAAGSGRS